MEIHVGNLSYSVTEPQLRELFAPYGEVASAKVVMDRISGRSKGFGFVMMPNGEEGNAAIAALNEKDFAGRPLRLSEARPREERPPRSFDGPPRDFGAPRGDFGPRRDFGDRPPRRDFGDRPPRRDFGGRDSY